MAVGHIDQAEGTDILAGVHGSRMDAGLGADQDRHDQAGFGRGCRSQDRGGGAGMCDRRGNGLAASRHLDQPAEAVMIRELDIGQRHARAPYLLGWRFDLGLAADHLLAGLVDAATVEDDDMMLGALLAYRDRRDNRVPQPYGSLEPKALAQIDRARPRELRAEHGGDQTTTP
jgi:hypothetical protein